MPVGKTAKRFGIEANERLYQFSGAGARASLTADDVCDVVKLARAEDAGMARQDLLDQGRTQRGMPTTKIGNRLELP